MTDANIVRANLEHLSGLMEIEQLCFNDSYSDKILSENDFRQLILSDIDILLVSINERNVLGYGLAIVDKADSVADFESLAIHPHHQGEGIGRSLFSMIESSCRARNIRRLNLQIREDNYTLLKRYHNFGYKCYQVDEGFYLGGFSAIRMYRML